MSSSFAAQPPSMKDFADLEEENRKLRNKLKKVSVELREMHHRHSGPPKAAYGDDEWGRKGGKDDGDDDKVSTRYAYVTIDDI